jgi:hypothetical protein
MLIDQAIDQVERGRIVDRCLGRAHGASAVEDRKALKRELTGRFEQVIRPGDGRPQRALAVARRGNAARKERQRLVQPVQDRGGRQ